MAADFVTPPRNVEVKIWKAIHGFAQFGEIVALVRKVTGDEEGIGVARQQAVSPHYEFGVWRAILPVLVENLRARHPFLVIVGWAIGGRVIGYMEVHRDFELAAFLPEQIQPRIVKMQAALSRNGGRVPVSRIHTAHDAEAFIR